MLTRTFDNVKCSSFRADKHLMDCRQNMMYCRQRVDGLGMDCSDGLRMDCSG